MLEFHLLFHSFLATLGLSPISAYPQNNLKFSYVVSYKVLHELFKSIMLLSNIS